MDAAFAVYLAMLWAGADQALRLTALHASIVRTLGDRFFEVPRVYRVGHRRWSM